ncbi:MAG: YbaK/EbsC family protein [Anaerotruncus sp.]|nr:YbaK/EbsC family protein [Anaerotruncus sp.]
MSFESVKQFFQQRGKEDAVMEFEVSSATVELAAKAVGVIPARIAKTLSFEQGEGCLLIVAAGDARIDNRKFKDTFGMKAKMLAPERALELTGHAVGGVCPFAIENPSVKTVLDLSLKRFDTIFPACGSSNSAVQLTCEELYQFSNAAQWVDVCKDWA